jgi:eukaryotic-like serine/threonine-protein kinase
MAPELHRGATRSAASDQYAFAVTAFEALTGQLPFLGGTDDAMAAAKQGDPSSTAMQQLPPRIRALVLRALCPDPAARWPRLADLLEALADASRPRRRRASIVALGAVSIAVVGWFGTRNHEEPCASLDHELDSVWDAHRRRTLQEVFSRSGHPWAADVGATASAKLDTYSREWVDARTAVCEQRNAAAERNVAFSLRRFCLGASRAALHTATQLLLGGDDSTLQRSVDIIDELPKPESCLDVEVRTPRAHPPPPALLPQIEEIQADIARIGVLRTAGQYDEALSKAEFLVSRATDVGDIHDAAVAQLQVGDLQARLERPSATQELHEALSLGLSAARSDVVSKAASSIAWEAAADAELPTARTWIRHAESAAAAAAGDEGQDAIIANTRSYVHGIAGERDAQLRAAREAVTATEATHGRDSVRMTRVLNTLAVALYKSGEYSEAGTHAQQAIETIEMLVGPHHPRWPAAALMLASVRMQEGRHEAASDLLSRAYDVALTSFGPNHATTLTIRSGLAGARSSAGDFVEAARLHRSDLEAWLAHDGEETVSTATSRFNLGVALHRSGEVREAVRQLESARDVMAQKLSPEHPDLLAARAALADALVDLGDITQALPKLEALLQDAKADAPVLATTRFALARALWTQQPGSAEAMDLGKKARESFAELGYTKTVEQIDRWLASVEQSVQPK